MMTLSVVELSAGTLSAITACYGIMVLAASNKEEQEVKKAKEQAQSF